MHDYTCMHWCTDYAKAEAPVAGPHPADACRPPSAPCGAGAGPTSWAALPTWQPTDGHAPPHEWTGPANRRPPRMGTRWPLPLLPTGKPLRGVTLHYYHYRLHMRTYSTNNTHAWARTHAHTYARTHHTNIQCTHHNYYNLYTKQVINNGDTASVKLSIVSELSQ